MKKKASYRSELRTYVAHARMNEEEWKLFNSQAQKLGLSQSELSGRRCLPQRWK